MKIIIESASNGATMTVDLQDPESIPHRLVFMFGEDEGLEGMVEMLCEVRDHMGDAGSRYDKERVFVTIKHGDKYECKGCEICEDKK